MEMPIVETNPASFPDDRSRAALDFVHSLLTGSKSTQNSLAELLEELSRTFAASGAGLAQWPAGSVVARTGQPNETASPLPWHDRPELLTQIRSSPKGIQVPGSNGKSFLLVETGSSPGAGWLLWLEDSSDRSRSAAESAALMLAGSALMQWAAVHGNGARWAKQLEQVHRQRRLEEAAPLTRRLGHDFDNVLTGIMGFSELALAQLSPEAPARPFVTEILHAARQGTQMTLQLRWFSRRNAASVRPSSLASLLKEEESGLRAAWGKDPKLHIELPSLLPQVSIGTEPLTMLLRNLLANAREAITGPGSVSITATPTLLTQDDCLDLMGNPTPGPFVELAVTDDGCGFSAEASRLCLNELFFSTKPRHKGLGLAVVYGILQAHNGGLRIDAGAERGTSVKVYLPAAPGLAPSHAKQNGRERVLIVDDDPIILQLCSTTLERAGYQVHTALSGPEALTSYTAAAPDSFRLVISDILMPHMSGVDLARRLRNHDVNVNVLLMSGQVSADLAQEDLPGAGLEFLAKPFRPDGLLSAVRSALERGARRIPATAGSPA
jgi:signal transduction histidine kinase/ActR/RegA family two-component response regulator